MKFVVGAVLAAAIVGGSVFTAVWYNDNHQSHSRKCYVVDNVYGGGQHLECR